MSESRSRPSTGLRSARAQPANTADVPLYPSCAPAPPPRPNHPCDLHRAHPAPPSRRPETVTLQGGLGAGGNLVAIAAYAPLDLAALRTSLAERDLAWGVVYGAELDAWIGDARVLTDDHAPVDQILTPAPPLARPTG